MNMPLKILPVLLCFSFLPRAGFAEDGARTPAPAQFFKEAMPVWAAGREKEKNMALGFRAVFQAGASSAARLKIAASTRYRAYLNGKFLGAGPARAAHGWFRVDEYNLAPRIHNGENILAIEVTGYNINAFSVLDQPSFLLSEVEIDGSVVASTGEKTGAFEAFQLRERAQKVQRYSFQRPFTEYYRVNNGYDKWRASATAPVEKLELAVFPERRLLPRNTLPPAFDCLAPAGIYAKGTVKSIQPQHFNKDRSLTKIGPNLKGFTEAELEVAAASQEIQTIATDAQTILEAPPNATRLGANEFVTYNFGRDLSGFIGAKIKCPAPARLVLYFDEILTDGDVKQMNCQPEICNVVVYELDAGDYTLETVESYTFRYLKAIVLKGNCEIEQVYLREFAYPNNPAAVFHCGSEQLNKTFDAARQMMRQGMIDVLMGDPSRERTGWLLDAYWTSFAEKDLTGKSAVARNHYENYALAERFDRLPDGMIASAYPADFYNGLFLPTFGMWFMIQLENYALRGGDPGLINALRPKVEGLLQYFSKFENKDGLLEKLKGWIYIEESQANRHVQDVSYPANMIYSGALAAAARLYQKPELLQKVEKIRRAIREQSFNGEFFADNAVRDPLGQLKLAGNTSEVCQYLAFFFNIAEPGTHPALWETLTTEFGPRRGGQKLYPSVIPAGAFYGNYMRLDILSRHGLQKQMLHEIPAYFYNQIELTGTLWEHMSPTHGCNMTFGSYLCHILYRDILGIHRIDYGKKEITIRFTDVELEHCRGVLPVGDETIELQWRRTGGLIRYTLKVPDGYKARIENHGSAQLREEPGAQSI
ncbi:MAG: hypothetical protein LBM92_05635 [Opitutaceae bacterium]|jgi:alpha-L-rhamnosidase|nr:hypothetical protein [Opitutaceae bacterium]